MKIDGSYNCEYQNTQKHELIKLEFHFISIGRINVSKTTPSTAILT